MKKTARKQDIIRSLLFSPADNKKLVLKALHSNADAIVLDLEDAVTAQNKKNARQLCKEFLNSSAFEKRSVFARVNPSETGYHRADVSEVSCVNLDGFVLPKVYRKKDVIDFEHLLQQKEKELNLEEGYFKLIVLMETPESIFNALEIAQSSPRIIALLFGCEDFLTEMDGQHGDYGRSLLVPRHLVSMACRASGLIPIDAPYVKVKDLDGLRDHIHQASELGYEGMLVMTPNQIEIAHQLYSPNENDVTNAKQMLDDAEYTKAEGRGIDVKNGSFISPPTVKRAQKILDRYFRIKNKIS